MKLSIAFSIFAFAIGISSQALRGSPDGSTTAPVVSGATSTSDHSTGIAPPGTVSTGIGTTSATASGAAPAATPNESNTDANDDTLYRGKTSEMETVLMRDEGPLHFKTRPKEKIQEVDSLKNLHSSGSDPKFQTSFLNSGAASIESIGQKANEDREPAETKDPRFKTRHVAVAPDKSDEPEKTDSTPSPTPSPSASPAAKDSRGAKQ